MRHLNGIGLSLIFFFMCDFCYVNRQIGKVAAFERSYFNPYKRHSIDNRQQKRSLSKTLDNKRQSRRKYCVKDSRQLETQGANQSRENAKGLISIGRPYARYLFIAT